jgi:hypothetical protein
VALASALGAVSPAQAQRNAHEISRRIENTFALVIGNSADLAIPLTRRALARRFGKDQQEEVAPLAYSSLEPAQEGASAYRSDERAFSVTPLSQIIGKAEEDPDTARVPRPRPEREAVADIAADANADVEADAQGDAADPSDPSDPPVDLVAGAADPNIPHHVAAKARAPVAVAATTPSQDQPAAVQAPPPATGDASKPASELLASASCLKPSDVVDKDGDFDRNASILSGSGFCIEQERFKERRRTWRIQTVKTGRPGPLFTVMHDDEDASFDTAVGALSTYGGTLVAVETGGKRNQDGIDPNRNFSADGVGCKKLGDDATPLYTAFFRKLLTTDEPIIALHNNTGKRITTGGVGHVSMSSIPKEMERHKSNDPDGPLAGDRALVLLTSPIPVSTTSETLADQLSEKGVNALIERVAKDKGDCSLSNYTLLSGFPNYLNVTVDDDEKAKQRKIIDAILGGAGDTVAATQ